VNLKFINVSPVLPDEVAAISTLAGEIWRKHYPGIISPEQIEYMLAQRYRPEVIAAELSQPDSYWHKGEVDGRLVGFSSCKLLQPAAELKLDKLYICPQHQRRGFAAAFIETAARIADRSGCARLVLAVNKRNAQAIASYRHYGFEIERDIVADIGGGFVMDDYLMVKPLV